jgi:hypothetical protein
MPRRRSQRRRFRPIGEAARQPRGNVWVAPLPRLAQTLPLPMHMAWAADDYDDLRFAKGFVTWLFATLLFFWLPLVVLWVVLF